ncbi:rootletin isoform X2 [Austrofundulus limnaeus]|uniref:Rootletin isoform X2 n=1 Tax=Austrofundulus limnaeus TaxID=52670 RepID=A0A2I4BFG4_AUSLI|nr:PREDICTED: rootletin-like isoform X2 [Austrofundulus limnaeus]
MSSQEAQEGHSPRLEAVIQLDQMMSQSAVDLDQDSVPPGSMLLQNTEKDYRQKLQVFQEAQKRQAQLVLKLQTKVLRYKRRCGELEEKVLEKTSECEKTRLLMQAHLDSAERQKHAEEDLNTVIQKQSAQLQEEQRRSASLSQVNSVLREQLDQSATVNKELTESLWRARQESELRGNCLRRQRETCASRSSREQARLRALWRQAASLRSTFTQLRTFTDRTLCDMRSECVAVRLQLHGACVNFKAGGTGESACGGVEVSVLEKQLKDKLKETMGLQAQWEAEKMQLNSRVLELADTLKHIQSQECEKDASLHGAQISLDRMDLHARLEAALEQVDTFHDLLQERDAEKMELEQMIQEVQKESQEVQKALEESIRDSCRSHCSLELISSEKESLEMLLSGLQQEVNSQRVELEALRSSSLDLQRQRDLLRQQREDLETQLARQRTEAQRGEKSLQELDEKHANLHQELMSVKEALSQISLQKEMLEDDKASLTLALAKMETDTSTQQRALTKLQSQQAALKDSLTKMAALNEGLAKDKVELSRLVLQIEGEKTELDKRRRGAEAEQAAAREDAARSQMEMMDFLAEKQALESSHIQLQDVCQKLEVELSLLQKEKSEALEKYSQTRGQVQVLRDELCACRKELDLKSTAVRRVTQDWEELAKDKAALDVQLNSVNQKSCGLTQELLALRAEKESLETVLFETQELSASLEARSSRLEGERRSLVLANDALTRDAAKMRAEAAQQSGQVVKQRREFEEQMAEVERKAVLTLNNTKQVHREQMETELQKKEQQLSELMVQRAQIEEQLRRQLEEQRAHSQGELLQVQEELSRLQREFNQNLLQAESKKQQALFQKEVEKAALTEEIAALRQDLATAGVELERMQREALSKQEQDKNAMLVLRSELRGLQHQLEESLSSYQSSKNSLMEEVRERNQESEQAKQEVEMFRFL